MKSGVFFNRFAIASTSGHPGFVGSFAALLSSTFGLLLLAGCQAPSDASLPDEAPVRIEEQILRAGDVLNVSFPGTPNLNTQPTIRQDGRISLPIVGDVDAAGFTVAALTTDLIAKYSPQLVNKEVTVSLVTSNFFVYVSGAVLRAGPVKTDHVLNALEAVMEAGGPDTTKADMKKVDVIRTENGKTTKTTVNLESLMKGKSSKPFKLKAGDTVFVNEKTKWF